ncbi:putative zinc finger, CCHC-type, retrotransposon gag domain protein [Tanacetum coccineum]|uniref:Zinc finger, CCHC-type, retrotransposon gag domain protein n=1 Tax=Tanacetum coccineum TaxID=301880 RepID=A0ABQ4ZEH0_9ASTR
MIRRSCGSGRSGHEKKRASSTNTEDDHLVWLKPDKVVYASPSHSKGSSPHLVEWNVRVTLGLENANKIPWTEFKEMMTTEYCPDTEIQKMEHELWNLTLKGDDIETYINRFSELSLSVPELVPT